MGSKGLLPHVLIDGASSLTIDLAKHIISSGYYERHNQLLPIIWKTRPLFFNRILMIKEVLHLSDSFSLSTLCVDLLIGGDLEEAKVLVATARKAFKLNDEEKLRIACVGSHHRTVYHLMSTTDADTHNVSSEKLSPLKPNRGLYNVIWEKLAEIGGVEAVWLAPLYNGIVNKNVQQHSPDYNELKRQVRRNSKQQSTVFTSNSADIYWRSTVNDVETPNSWTLWQPSSGDGSRNTTTGIIDQFANDRDFDRKGKTFVLVKVLSDDLKHHNPLDTPIFDVDQRQKAVEAGINFVMIDHRVGIIWALGDTKVGVAAQVLV